jgi:hypothetical protein
MLAHTRSYLVLRPMLAHTRPYLVLRPMLAHTRPYLVLRPMLAHTRACFHTKLYLLKTHDCSYKNISACKFQACLHTRPLLPWTHNGCDESSSRTNFPFSLLLPVFLGGVIRLWLWMMLITRCIYLNKASRRARNLLFWIELQIVFHYRYVTHWHVCARAHTHT